MIVALLLAALQPAPAPAPPARAIPADPVSEEVVVTGLRDIDEAGSAVTRKTLGSGKTGAGARRSRAVFDQAQRYARCAITDSPAILTVVRKALDGVVNGSNQRFWQQWLVDKRAACSQDTVLHVAVVSADYDASYYERGALFVEALRRFAPRLSLTAAQTGDPAVQARFDAREIPLARFRLPVDRRYFEVAVCVVRLQPTLASRLVATSDSDGMLRLEAAMVNRAKACVGGARQVYFDPIQFRFYIADAVYRWAAAAQGVDSLIPIEGALPAAADRTKAR